MRFHRAHGGWCDNGLRYIGLSCEKPGIGSGVTRSRTRLTRCPETCFPKLGRSLTAVCIVGHVGRYEAKDDDILVVSSIALGERASLFLTVVSGGH